MSPRSWLEWMFPPVQIKTDRIVQRLIVAELVLIAFATATASWPVAIFAIMFAAGGTGAVTGLLFAIPKRLTLTENQAEADGSRPNVGIVANTSLEEVSDWLTKTIVGGGLVSWPMVLAKLDHAGAKVGRSLLGPTIDTDVGEAAGVALLVASGSLAGLAAYLWFSRHLPREMRDADDEARAAARDLRALEKEGLAPSHDLVAPPVPTISQPPDATETSRSGESDAAIRGSSVEFTAGESEEAKTTGNQPPLSDKAEEAEAVTAQAAPGDPAARLIDAVNAKYARMRESPVYPDDWAKGLFGGRSIVDNGFGRRSLSATVKKRSDDWYEVKLRVLAMPKPATDAVLFLHNTFPNSTPTTEFDEQGVATLTLAAWGAFTVGALLDDGSTELELDLAELKKAPRTFRDR